MEENCIKPKPNWVIEEENKHKTYNKIINYSCNRVKEIINDPHTGKRGRPRKAVPLLNFCTLLKMTFIRKVLEPITKDNKRWANSSCPFCRAESFSINKAKNVYYCNTCYNNGDALAFMALLLTYSYEDLRRQILSLVQPDDFHALSKLLEERLLSNRRQVVDSSETTEKEKNV
jgi:hypothetical protein